MRIRTAPRERTCDDARGFPNRDGHRNAPAASSARYRGISAPSLLLRLALLTGILAGGAAGSHDPIDNGAHVGGNVYALDLLPNRGPALGGTRVTFHGAGFTKDMACQFGPHIVHPSHVSTDGSTRACVTPPFGRPAGGFIAVGITITTPKGWPDRAGAGRNEGGGRPVVTPRGARSFEYSPAWILRSVKPSEIDSTGGAVVAVRGAHLHAAGSCRFDSPTGGGSPGRGGSGSVFVNAHVVSSALVVCEAPATRPGVGSLALVSEDPFDAVAAETARAASSGEFLDDVVARSGGGASDPVPGASDAGVPGLALGSRRRPFVSRVVATSATSLGGGTYLTVYGGGFVGSTGTSSRDDGFKPDGAGGGDGDGDGAGADVAGNGPGCAVGTVWVSASSASPGHVSCVAPFISRADTQLAYHDVRDPATGGYDWRTITYPDRGGEGGLDADAGSFIAIPSTASIGGGSAIDFFGSRPAAVAAALANAFACADDAGAHEGIHDAYTFRCVAGPRPGGGFVAVAASGGRSGGQLSSGSISFAFAPTPESRRIAPREGPSHGGYPVWVYGSDLHAGSGSFGHGESPAMCLFVTTGADSTGVDAVVVSSVLAVCEAPAVPTQGAGSAGDTRALAVEFGTHALGWSTDGQAISAWPSSLATFAASPSVAAAAGGSRLAIGGRAFPPSADAVVCRVGSVGPITAHRESSSTLSCVTPAAAPRLNVPVAGPVSSSAGDVFVTVVDAGGSGVGIPALFPARTASAGSGSTVNASKTIDGDVRLATTRVYRTTGASTPSFAALARWLDDGAARCVFGAVAYVGDDDASLAVLGTNGGHDVECRPPLAPAGFASARVVAAGGVEVLSGIDVEFRLAPVAVRVSGGGGGGVGGEATATAGENAVFDVYGSGFFRGLTCVWNGVAETEANVLSSTAARCEQPGVRTLSTAAASGESVVTLGLVPGGTQAGGLGSGTVVDGPVAWARPHPAEVSAVGPSHGPSSGGSAVTVQGGGFSREFSRASCRIGAIGPIAGSPPGNTAVRCTTPAHTSGAVTVTVLGAVGGGTFVYVTNGDGYRAGGRRSASSPAPVSISSEGTVDGAVDAYTEGLGGGVPTGYLCVLGDYDGFASATKKGAGWTRCGGLPSVASGFTTISVAAPGPAADSSTTTTLLASVAAAMGDIEVYTQPEVHAVIPRDVVSGRDATLTLLGEHQRRAGGFDFWCFYGDGISVRARSVSSAVATCEILPGTDERRPARSLASKTSASASAWTRRVDLAAPTSNRGAGGPCASTESGCRSFKHFPAPAALNSVSPASIPAGGGSAVALNGIGFADVSDLACRFGSVGPVSAAWGSSGVVRCVAPAKAPGLVAVSALGAFDANATLAFREPVSVSVNGAFATARRAGGPTMLVSASVGGGVLKSERLTATVLGESGVGERAACLGGCGGRGAGPLLARFPAPGVRVIGGPAFRVVALGFDAETASFGGEDPADAGASPFFSASRGRNAIEMQYVDDPIVAAASPAAASVEGGSLITLTGAPGASSFRVDDSRGAWCHFGQVASVGNIVSSSVVVCEAPSVDKEDTVSLGAAIDGVWVESPGVLRAVPFSHRAPIVTLAVTPGRADWLASPALAVTGRGFASVDSERTHCRVGTIGPIAATHASAVEVRCTAPAHNGARDAVPVVVSGGSDSVARTSAWIEFTVDASRMDPSGAPGGKSASPASHDGDALTVASTPTQRASNAVLRTVLPFATTGGRPLRLHGQDVLHDECWCLFGSTFATKMLRVSSAVSRCAEAPPPWMSETRAVRVACAWGTDGPPTARSALAEYESSRSSESDSVSVAEAAKAFAIGESRGAFAVVPRPTIESVKPARVSGGGGVVVTVTASRLHHAEDDADGDGSRYGCHFGPVGPVAARSISAEKLSCVAPSLGGRSVVVGASLDANVAEVEWRRTAADHIRVDSHYLRGFEPRGVDGVGVPSGGSAHGGVAHEVMNVAGFHDPSAPVRCAFGDVFVTGAWLHRGPGSASGLASVKCVVPPRLTSAGFVPVRVFADGSSLKNALGSANVQFSISPDARVKVVFPRLSWGAEVVSVGGEHLAGPGDASQGGHLDSDSTSCVFAGSASPARIVSSSVITCEVPAGVPIVRRPGQGGKGVTWWGPDHGDESSRALAAVSDASKDLEYDRNGHGSVVQPTANGLRPVTACARGGSCGGDSEGTGTNMLWFQSTGATSPIKADIDEGFSDGGTLVRLALSTALPPDWLDCRFGTIAVPARPVVYHDPAVDAKSAELLADARTQLGGVDMDLECISPGHAPGTVNVEVALTHSKMPSFGADVGFLYV